MSQVVPDVGALRSPLSFFYAPIRDELAEVEAILARELTSEYPAIDQIVKHVFHLGGKRLRPALLLLTAKACGTITRDHLTLAAVVEMIHTATLVHDDILDEAHLRRYRQTVNARWSNEASVLVGDFLFTHSFYLASTLDTTFACRTIGRATNIVCEGELRQVQSRGNFELSEEDYRGIIEAKTGELCACCCALGAHYAGANEDTVEAMGRFGRLLGVAFQIADDLLDLLGTETATGKSLGTDLEKQKMTLPLIRLLQQSDRHQRQRLVRLLADGSPGARDEMRELVAHSEAVDYAREVATGMARQAREELQALPASETTSVLEELSDFVVSRRL